MLGILGQADVQHQGQGAEHDGKAVHHMGHGDQAHVLAEGGNGRAAEHTADDHGTDHDAVILRRGGEAGGQRSKPLTGRMSVYNWKTIKIRRCPKRVAA